MKTLIVPDIHTKWQKADALVKRYEDKVDEIVCLGDYFDDFGDSPKLNGRTAEWLKKFMEKKTHTALLGNHEFNYMYDKKIDLCSGYSSSKNWKVNRTLTTKDWNKLVPYYKSQGWYFTHAGITEKLVSHPVKGWDEEYFEKTVQKDMDKLILNVAGHIFRVGMARGGKYAYGGFTWCHFPDDFEPIKEIKQVFGHTPGKEVRQYKNTDNWCLDTHLNHYAIIEDGKIKIKEL